MFAFGLSSRADTIVNAQRFSVHTNLLYWATTTPNISLEWRLNPHLSLSATLGYNAWNFKNTRNESDDWVNPKFHHWLVMPELKYWTRQPFKGHYLGLHLIGGEFNVGGLKFPNFLKDTRYDGWAVGAGISYGYNWKIGKNWGMEVSIGAGYAHLGYRKYKCGNCGKSLGRFRRDYFGPTKAAISISYYIGGNTKVIHTADTIYVPEPYEVVKERIVEVPALVASPVEVAIDGMQTVNIHLKYPMDGAEVIPDFADNAEELKRVGNLLMPLSSEVSLSQITDIVIVGYASPEAPADYNMDLSQRRADGMRDYILAHYDIPAELIIATEGKGEDWNGVARYSEDENQVLHKKISGIIESVSDKDRREVLLRNLEDGEIFEYLLQNVFPELRRIEVKVYYKPVDKEGKR